MNFQHFAYVEHCQKKKCVKNTVQIYKRQTKLFCNIMGKKEWINNYNEDICTIYI